MTTWQDVRYALRLLVKSPGFALTSVLTLALAIGANAAIFSAVKGILVAPLPYPEPDSLVRLFEESATTPHFPMAPADFRDYRAELRTFEGLAAYMRNDLQIAEDGRPEQLRGMQATAGFFTVVGFRPLLGRDFALDDEIQGSTDVVVLSHAFWMRRFNSDAAIVGQVHPAVGPDVSGDRRASGRLQARGRHLQDVQPRGERRCLVAVAGASYRSARSSLLALLQRRRPHSPGCLVGSDGRRTSRRRGGASRSVTRRRTAPGHRAPSR